MFERDGELGGPWPAGRGPEGEGAGAVDEPGGHGDVADPGGPTV